MPRGPTGRRVARAAASGASRSHRGRAPLGWYASLVLICIVGISLIVYSRYELQRAASTTTTTTTVAADSYVGISFDVCGTVTTLPVSTNSIPVGISSVGSGLIQVAPATTAKGAAASANNATLGTFIKDYLPSMKLTANELQLPGKAEPIWTNGLSCSSAAFIGQPGVVQAKVWKQIASPTGTLVKGTDLLGIKLTAGEMITVAFLPAGASIPPAPTATQSLLGQSLTPGFTPPSSTTTTTTKPGKKGTTTTTSPGEKSTTSTTTSGSTTTTSSATSTT
jgi:hypothetical protein